jgi:DNA polymerase-3 subunit alpha
VKNVGVNTIDAMVAERERAGPFRSIFDIARRVGHDAINRRVLESLVAAGALDALHPSRGRLFAVVPGALEAGARFQRDQAMGQTLLFGAGGEGDDDDADPPDVPEWDRNTRLRREKEVLGFYLTEHPLDAYRDEISAVASGDTDRLKTFPNGSDVGLLGVVTAVNRRIDKKGRPFGFAQVEDYAGVVECVFFSDVFEKAKGFLEPDRVVLVRGRLDRRDPQGEPKIVASEAFDFEASRGELAHTLYVRVPLSGLEEGRLAAIGGILERYPGRGDVVICLETQSGRRVRMKSGRYRVGVHPDLLTELRAELGEESVRLGETVNGRNGR